MTSDSDDPTGLPACAYPLYTVPGMRHAVKLRYGVDNLGEVGFTALHNTATLFKNHHYISSSGTPVSTKFTATYVGMVVE